MGSTRIASTPRVCDPCGPQHRPEDFMSDDLSIPREIDYDAAHARLRVRFDYDRAIVEIIRGLPGRRWDKQAREWLIPAVYLDMVQEALDGFGFSLTPAAQRLSDGDTEPETPSHPENVTAAPLSKQDSALVEAHRSLLQLPARSITPRKSIIPFEDGDGEEASSPGAAQAYPISELNRLVHRAIRSAFPEPVWIIGELVGYNRSTRGSSRGHIFFDLVEKPEGSDEVTARVSAVMWARSRAEMKRKLAELPQPFELEDGIEVRLLVSVDMYPARGQYQLVVHDIDPHYTLGRLALRREAILAELARRDLLHRNRELPMPLAPLRVALLTSPGREACIDFLHELERSGYGFQVDLFGVRVQGLHLAPTVLDALARIAAHPHRYDVVVIVRGGGSRADLAWFDQLEVAVAVAELPIKVVVGIGHHSDQSILDLLALSEKTPTAAGELLASSVDDLLTQQDELWHHLTTAVHAQIGDQHEQLNALAGSLSTGFTQHIGQRKSEIASLRGRLGPQARQLVSRHRDRLDYAARHLAMGARSGIRLVSRDLDRVQESLSSQAMGRRMNRDRERIDALAARLGTAAREVARRQKDAVERLEMQRQLLDPARMIARGFARVRTAEGKVATRAEHFAPEERMIVEFADGSIRATVEAVDTDVDLTSTSQ